MADRGASAPRGGGGFGSRGGERGGDRGRGDRGRGRGRGRGRRGGKSEEKEWQPVTKLGRLVKAGKISTMEEIYLHSLPIKEYQIVDWFLPKLKDEVMKVRGRKVLGRIIILISLVQTDQARPEADPRGTAHPIQGHRHYWRLRGPRWSRHQDVQGSGHCHSRGHNHCEVERHPRPSRLLGRQPWSASFHTCEGEWKVRLRHSSCTYHRPPCSVRTQ